MPACLQKYNQTKTVFLAKCHHLDVAVKLLLGGFESIRGFANLGNEARGWTALEGVCVTECLKSSLLPLYLLEEVDKRGEFVHIVVA
ncbi:MAG: hypothetical protein IPJ53_00205 [Saprospiraceae bacterium]|nr:hypothetical protein [Candidatus Vicinibacter affinis]